MILLINLHQLKNKENIIDKLLATTCSSGFFNLLLDYIVHDKLHHHVPFTLRFSLHTAYLQSIIFSPIVVQ